MSKEQTPITAEEWLNEEYSYILDGFEYLEIDKQVLDVMEQYAQAKVLEERDRINRVIESIPFQDPAVGEFYEELKTKV